MKERKKGEHAMVRKLFMMMAAFVLILCMKTTTYAASTKTVNMESVGSGMYIHIGTMKRGKGTVYHRVKVKKRQQKNDNQPATVSVLYLQNYIHVTS